jgi:hypothetical protein
MITADPNSHLGYLCKKVDGMKVGECLTLGLEGLRDIPSFEHNGATFSPADRILGNIMGSAYTHSYSINHLDGTVTFTRHENTGERWYKEPDHDYRVSRLRKEGDAS